ncbi:MAG: alpha-ketoacid dehydrogenase subunit beta [Firmicutes bacterium]|nr:alpha-ketoacid dehydrogenase subunit beta [Clostridiales bacterium]MBQ9931438.1 alpha-ketoacid dehydrogenase subunit beta [Bacillota bacterium]
MREIAYRDGICEVIDEAMANDPNVMIMGEDVAFIGGNFKCTVGLYEKYGDMRVKDTPISEQGFLGMGIGMAMTGLRPIVELMFSDFLLVAGDQAFNQASKITYMSGGQVSVPMVIRGPIGAGRSSAAQHSQSMQAIAAHFPGMKVVVPSNAQEVMGLLKTAIADNNPVLFLEHKMEYSKKFMVDDVVEPIPFGQARIAREGKDITVVATSALVMRAEEAAEELAKKHGIDVEVIDLRTVVPLDRETIINSVKKTGRLIVADDSYEFCGVAGEIGMNVLDDVFYYLDAPIARVATPNIVLPFSPALEFPIIPSKKKIFDKVLEVMGQ